MVNSNWKCKTLQESKLSNCLQYSKTSCVRETYESFHHIPWGIRIFPPIAGMVPGGIVARIAGKVCAVFGQSLFFCSRPCPPHRPYRPLQDHFHGHGLPPFFSNHAQNTSRPCPQNLDCKKRIVEKLYYILHRSATL